MTPSGPAPRQLDVLWADAEFEGLTLDFDTVVLTLEETTGVQVTIRCQGHIGLEQVGLWDEVVIDRGALSDSGSLLDRCRAQLERNPAFGQTSGSPLRNRRTFRQLTIEFGDGSHLAIAAAHFEVERGGPC